MIYLLFNLSWTKTWASIKTYLITYPSCSYGDPLASRDNRCLRSNGKDSIHCILFSVSSFVYKPICQLGSLSEGLREYSLGEGLEKAWRRLDTSWKIIGLCKNEERECCCRQLKTKAVFFNPKIQRGPVPIDQQTPSRRPWIPYLEQKYFQPASCYGRKTIQSFKTNLHPADHSKKVYRTIKISLTQPSTGRSNLKYRLLMN